MFFSRQFQLIFQESIFFTFFLFFLFIWLIFSSASMLFAFVLWFFINSEWPKQQSIKSTHYNNANRTIYFLMVHWKQFRFGVIHSMSLEKFTGHKTLTEKRLKILFVWAKASFSWVINVSLNWKNVCKNVHSNSIRSIIFWSKNDRFDLISEIAMTLALISALLQKNYRQKWMRYCLTSCNRNMIGSFSTDTNLTSNFIRMSLVRLNDCAFQGNIIIFIIGKSNVYPIYQS